VTVNNLIDGKNFLILDDLLTVEEVKNIQKTFMSLEFPWYSSENDATVNPLEYNKHSDENTYEYFQMCHHFVIDGEITSEWTKDIYPIISKIEKHINHHLKFRRIKVNLQSKVENRKLYNCPHRDDNSEHYVILYYVNESDGKTYIFKNHERPWIIEKIIDSKPGRCVIFNGAKYHAGSHPSEGRRMVINFVVGDAEEKIN
jgi:hypothetical protein